jgi:hypothetical protein
MIPVLPDKLRLFSDAPVPLLIGVCYDYSISEFPPDSIIMDLDKNKVENYSDKLPKLPVKLYTNMSKRLEKALCEFNREDENRKSKVMFAEEVFNFSEDLSEGVGRFNTPEIRDIFYEFFVIMFKNHEKYFPNTKGKKKLDGTDASSFNKDVFLKDHASTEVLNIYPSLVHSFINLQKQTFFQFSKIILKSKQMM